MNENPQFEVKDDKHAKQLVTLAGEVNRVKKRNPRRAQEINAERTAELDPPEAIETALPAAIETLRTGDPEPVIDALAVALSKLGSYTAEQLEKAEADAKARDREAKDKGAREFRLHIWNEMCPERYNETFEVAKVKPEVDRAKLAKVLGWEYSDRGLYVIGESGHSKSRAVYTRLKTLHVEDCRRVLAMDGIQFSNEASANAYGNSSEDWFKKLLKPDVLFLDDLGKRWTAATEEAVFIIVERRSAWKKPTCITINYTSAELQAMATDEKVVGPFIRRVKDYFEIVAL